LGLGLLSWRIVYLAQGAESWSSLGALAQPALGQLWAWPLKTAYALTGYAH